ncbi:NAD-dependent deacylase [Rhizosaccharibacter radicis]|uniref:NAD-dependent protein deacylase n=1 Tax=Rhizosaccharibacter radicis TaxID=2782605 RepID=A0ABT1VVU4_9PROT|nr:NAD-dependent deacylase [Acetobacteraceae bacterium KSS12]
MTSSFRHIVVLTGAGISRESGLHTFRDLDGIWAQVRLEDVCTPEAFERDPAGVHAFYNARRAQLADVAPNDAHRALAALEAAVTDGRLGADASLLVVTQNIDDLHERAGTRSLLHMHGELRRVRCNSCGATPAWDGPADGRTPCPACGRTTLRPDVVWFGEVPMHMDRIGEALGRCDLFVSIGTSGTVYPAAGFCEFAGRHARTVELNLEPTPGRTAFDEQQAGPATVLVPRFVSDLLDGR